MTAYNIHQVLAEMQASGDQAFHIRFVKSTEPDQGEIIDRMCYFGAPNPKNRAAPTATQRGRAQRKLHVDSGTVPLTEAGTRQMQTPRIDHIIGFKQKPVYR